MQEISAYKLINEKLQPYLTHTIKGAGLKKFLSIF